MFLSVITTHRPATDLGFLLMKHPDRVHEFELSFGKASVFFPQADEACCEAVLALDIDPVGLVRGRGAGDGLLDHYVNDRPYAASSFLSVALNRAFRSAMAGSSRERAELAATPIPLAIRLTPLPVRGGEALVRELFEPLGWTVELDFIPAANGPSRYADLKLSGTLTLAEAFNHLYVLIPVLDADKHYWIGDDEVDKLVAKGGAWLQKHPAIETITSRYLKRRRGLVRAALAKLAPEEIEATEAPQAKESREEKIEAPLRLHDIRLDAVADRLEATGATIIADLGCGEGRLLQRLLRKRQFKTIIGLDASSQSLQRAREKLKLDLSGGPPEGRVKLLHGALTYRDERWHTAEAVALVEVIEHLDPDRLPHLAEIVFGAARPRTVVITTPNADYNALFENLRAGAFRHPDHRFEWTRAEMQAWATGIEARYGYRAEHSGLGEADPQHGAPSQMVVFTR
ncbi:3' terminal RNA ribose 2'-O-methyltransferase Hen1 [Labrys miyagiensis]|uniref:Small RNA 2'-O-methyltransferase n=1 Tax=Labrys miyagiensis TaxID=346912 RepID=A0ABQ6CCR9_9HYPH|nr:3' terminal RNA ribose 2'-O-methyltransferase Hen1 [Labrys miyagiensis]GLS17467.1 3' terminal RNA ribose 2'-O-methyltransferase Hen1 [Labrys miyagiensis]